MVILPALPRIRVQAVDVLPESPRLAKIGVLRSQADLTIQL